MTIMTRDDWGRTQFRPTKEHTHCKFYNDDDDGNDGEWGMMAILYVSKE
jgi:hypothetical protein